MLEVIGQHPRTYQVEIQRAVVLAENESSQ